MGGMVIRYRGIALDEFWCSRMHTDPSSPPFPPPPSPIWTPSPTTHVLQHLLESSPPTETILCWTRAVKSVAWIIYKCRIDGISCQSRPVMTACWNWLSQGQISGYASSPGAKAPGGTNRLRLPSWLSSPVSKLLIYSGLLPCPCIHCSLVGSHCSRYMDIPWVFVPVEEKRIYAEGISGRPREPLSRYFCSLYRTFLRGCYSDVVRDSAAYISVAFGCNTHGFPVTPTDTDKHNARFPACTTWSILDCQKLWNTISPNCGYISAVY